MAVEIALTQGKSAVVDDADAPLVAGYTWRAWRHRNTWYARVWECKDGVYKLLLMHRVILSDAEEVDHFDGDGLNNRRVNLRASTTRNNHRNMRVQSGRSSQFKGVTWFKRDSKWRAQISAGPILENGKSKNLHLGYFADEADAARAYDAAARRAFGEFAALNFPGPGENACRGRKQP